MRLQAYGKRRAFTLVEMLFAVVILFIVFAGIMTFMQTGQRSVVVSWDHAQARNDCLRILDIIEEDMDRLVIADSIDGSDWIDGDWPGVLEPIKLPSGENAEQSTEFLFFGMHHREYYVNSAPPAGEQPTRLVAQLIKYRVEPREDGHGVDLLRNGDPVNIRWMSEKQRQQALASGASLEDLTFPLHDVKFEWLSQAEADELAVFPKHAFKVTIEPLGDWDKTSRRARNLAKGAAVTRLFHLAGVESYFAVLVSLVDVGAPEITASPIYSRIQDMTSKIHRPDSQFDLSTPLDWIRPPGLVVCDETAIFDDATVGVPVKK